MKPSYLEPTRESGAALMRRCIPGEVVMLNLLRLREVADYSGAPELAPARPISGREALRRYIHHTLPFLRDSGGKLLFIGDGAGFFIGPSDERWDVIMLVRQRSVGAFLAFAANADYLAGTGHRTAAILDARLLPVVECKSRI